MQRFNLLLFISLITFLTLPAFTESVEAANRIELISVGDNEEIGEGSSLSPSINYDGRYITFNSKAFNFFPPNPSGYYQDGTFIRDHLLKTTTHASLEDNRDDPSQPDTSMPILMIEPNALSEDGNFVLFVSPVTVPTNDIYVRDIALGTLDLVSKSTTGSEGNGFSSQPSMTPDARFIVFTSTSTNLDSNWQTGGVFLRDRLLGTTELVNLDSNDNIVSGGTSYISNYGEYIVWSSNNEIYIRNRINNSTINFSGTNPRISGDGNYIFYFIDNDLKVYNQITETHTDVANNIDTETYDISDDGNIVTFVSNTSLVERDTNPEADVYTFNRQTALYELISISDDGSQPDNASPEDPTISGNGRYVVFRSDSIAYTVDDTNSFTDLYLVDRTETPPPPPPSEPQTVTFNASADTYVRGGHDNQNEGAGQFMRIQSSGSNRALVRFDQGALQSAVGNGEILSATLRLTITDNGNNWGTTGRTVDIHRLIADWAEGNGTENDRGTGNGATWSCATDSLIENLVKNCSGSSEWEMGQPNNPAVHPWNETASATQTITNNQTGVVEYDVTADVEGFLNGTENYGWIVKKTEEGQAGQVSFGTKESASIPQLIVTYQP